MNLGNTIKLVRKKRGYTQSQLADRADISVSHLCLLEKGKRDPSLSTIEAISNALSIPVSVLIFLAADNEQITELTENQIEELTRNIMGIIDGVSRQKSLF